jgi:hypothetical protein
VCVELFHTHNNTVTPHDKHRLDIDQKSNETHCAAADLEIDTHFLLFLLFYIALHKVIQPRDRANTLMECTVNESTTRCSDLQVPCILCFFG